MKAAAYRSYLLSVLMLILAFNNVDRLALGLVLQDIKLDFQLSDTQLGLLTGIAFALFYSTMGIPIARWADRGNRVTIIAVTTALWSAAVALCGLASTFVHLLLIRVGVAVGEAGCMPTAQSLIADYFNRAERARALAIYMLGGPLSLAIGYFLAGWLNELFGWRTTFMALGLPGIVLAAVSWVTLREPRALKPAASGRQTAPPDPQAAQPSLREVCATLWGKTTFRHLVFCYSVVFFFGYGVLQWKPAFFIRSFGLETGELGTWFAVIYGVGGLVGTYWGGELATRRAKNDERLQLKVMALAYASVGLISTFIYLASNHYVAFGIMGIATMGIAAANGPLFAIIQTIVPPRMRAISIAILYLFANLIGMGLGPLAAGALSDALQPAFGQESLRYALLLMCPGYFWAGWHLWRGSRTVHRDIELVSAIPNAQAESGARDDSAEPLVVREYRTVRR